MQKLMETGWRIGSLFICMLISYLHRMYHKSMFYMKISILLNIFYFFLDLQTLQSKTIPFINPKNYPKLRFLWDKPVQH